MTCSPPASSSLQRWHMQTQRVAMFKSFNHTTAQGPMWHCTLRHWRPVLLMLSRVKYGSVVGNALCCWFKVGWSRNNGHEKNMARPCEWQPTSITLAGAVPKMVHESGYIWRNVHTRVRRRIAVPNVFSLISITGRMTGLGVISTLCVYVTHTSPSRQSALSLSVWVKLNLVWVWCLIALISSRRSHQLFCAINRLPPRCYEAQCCSRSGGKKEKRKEGCN